jgi:hypothetical protein
MDFQMMRRRLTPANTPPASRAASSRSVERKPEYTGCVEMNMSRSGIAHTANLSQEVNIPRGINMRMRAIGKKKIVKKNAGYVISGIIRSTAVRKHI